MQRYLAGFEDEVDGAVGDEKTSERKKDVYFDSRRRHATQKYDACVVARSVSRRLLNSKSGAERQLAGS